MRSVSSKSCCIHAFFSDVTDVAWSPGDRYLASVGLDSAVMVWCGFTLGISLVSPIYFFAFADAFRSERLRKLDLHQGFVKGVCWDPVGEFLATQSDDRSVKIWKTSDWSIEAEVKKPFEDSPGSTFFRRLRCDFFFYFQVAFYLKFTL